MSTFRDRIDAAIAAHRPLDTPEFRSLATLASAEERRDWQMQVQLDAAVSAWQHELRVVRPRRSVPRRIAAAIAVAAAGIVVGWLGRAGDIATPGETAPADLVVLSETRPVADVEPASLDDATPSSSVQSEQFAEAAATANRLAYALEPVGERVQFVVRFLVDAVPGSDVFAMPDAGNAI